MDNAETLNERQTDDGWATKAHRGGDEDTKEEQRRDGNERKQIRRRGNDGTTDAQQMHDEET